MNLLFIWIFLLHQIGCDKMEDEIVTEEKNLFFTSYGKFDYKIKEM